jgi:hypothetical protein
VDGWVDQGVPAHDHFIAWSCSHVTKAREFDSTLFSMHTYCIALAGSTVPVPYRAHLTESGRTATVVARVCPWRSAASLIEHPETQQD